MSNYGQQPNPYGPNQSGQSPYGQQGGNPYQQSQQPYGQRPGQQPYGQQPGQQPWAPPGQPQPGQPPYGQPQPGQPQPGPPYVQQPQYPQPGQPQPGGWTPQPASVARPAIASRAIAVVTMDAVPGREIAAVIGDAVGVVVRPRELAPELRAGNPLDGYATMLTRSRQDAVTKMLDMAVAAGADAVVGFRYDCSEITQSLSEVSAYGTAVKLAPETDVVPGDGSAAETDESAENPARDEASSATSLNSPASSATPSSQPRPSSDDGGESDDRPWPPSSWPSQT